MQTRNVDPRFLRIVQPVMSTGQLTLTADELTALEKSIASQARMLRLCAKTYEPCDLPQLERDANSLHSLALKVCQAFPVTTLAVQS